MARRKRTPTKPVAKTAVVSFRCPQTLLPKLDTHVKQLNENAPGGNWTRSSAALNLVHDKLKELQPEVDDDAKGEQNGSEAK
jgi:hypothetical protein